jgi:hypothetical protein
MQRSAFHMNQNCKNTRKSPYDLREYKRHRRDNDGYGVGDKNTHSIDLIKSCTIEKSA